MKNQDHNSLPPEKDSGLLTNDSWEAGTTEVTIEKTIRRFSFKTIFTDVLDAFMFNRGLFYTIKQLFIAPGESIRGYLGTDRFRLSSPVRYFILLSGIMVLLYFKFGIIDEIKSTTEATTKLIAPDESVDISFMEFIYDYLSLLMALALFFYAIFSRWLFKVGYNYVEHLIINTYIVGQGFVLYIFNISIYLLTGNFVLFSSINSLLFLIYFIYVYVKVFRQPLFKTIWKSLVVYFLGYISFVMFAGFTGAVVGIAMGIIEKLGN